MIKFPKLTEIEKLKNKLAYIEARKQVKCVVNEPYYNWLKNYIQQLEA